VVSAWNNDVSWIGNYTNNYVIYDKSHTLNNANTRIYRPKNVGYNIYDIFHFIITNYTALPEYVAFLEGNPFDHCRKETFDKLICNEKFTPIEDYAHIQESYAHKKDIDGGYMEINNSWYLISHAKTFGYDACRYPGDYNTLLHELFEDATPPEYVRFSPGGQYIVPKHNILYYTSSLYYKLISLVEYHRVPAEAHMIERMLYYIFINKWKEKR